LGYSAKTPLRIFLLFFAGTDLSTFSGVFLFGYTSVSNCGESSFNAIYFHLKEGCEEQGSLLELGFLGGIPLSCC